MFCPQCGLVQSDELRFCKSCGANLDAVRQVVATRETAEQFDWSRTWVAEMFMSAGEVKRRKEELERQRGITPEMKRFTEIKSGVITGCVGIGLAIFLYVLMRGIIRSGNVPPDAVEILSHLWVVAVIPFFVGVAFIINGMFVSKGLIEMTKQGRLTRTGESERNTLLAADTSEFVPAGFSVTEETTKLLNHRTETRSTEQILNGKAETYREV